MVDYDSRLARQRALLADRRGDTIHDRDADAFERHANTYSRDPEHRRLRPPENDDTWSNSTVVLRLQHLQQTALAADRPLTELSTDDMNALLDGFVTDLSVDTLRQRQLAVSKLLWHAERDPAMPEYAAEHGKIYIDAQPETSVEKADLLTWEDIDALREGCRNDRDRALLEMMLYTGQRITALHTLRIKDVFLDHGPNGEFRLNPEYTDNGLKGASGRRPLLGSAGALRHWLNTGHPDPKNPDAFVFTPLPQYVENPDVTKPLTDSTLRSAIERLQKRTGVTRPCNPHNFRHTFVTLAYHEYGLEKDYIKKLLGHDDGSTVMETTYRHLDDDDAIKKAEEAFGIRDEDEDSTLTPKTCFCGAGLSPNDKACSHCGLVWTPDAAAAQQSLDDDVKDSYAQTMPEGDLQAKLATFESLLDDPEVEAYLRDRVDG